MALTPLHVRDVCCSNYNGPYCKYLSGVNRSDGKYVHVCTKLNKGAYEKLEKDRYQWISGVATGDNCKGYLLLHYKQQGYDK